MIARVQHRLTNGLSANFIFTYSKNLVGGAGGDPNLPGGRSGAWQFYNWRTTKSVTASHQKFQFVNQVTYELPFGRGRRYLNRGGMWPQTSQKPFYNIGAFTHPAAFTPGNAGFGIARTGWLWGPQYFAHQNVILPRAVQADSAHGRQQSISTDPLAEYGL